MGRSQLLVCSLHSPCLILTFLALNSITARLTEMGYGDELSFLEGLRLTFPVETVITLFSKHKLVRQPKPLNNRGLCFIL